MAQRIAIVTGAARGIGAGTAKRLASDGMAVAVLDLNEADGAQTVAEIEKAGGMAIAVGADVSNADQVQQAVERVAQQIEKKGEVMGPRAAKKTMLAKQVLQEMNATGRVSKKTQLAAADEMRAATE